MYFIVEFRLLIKQASYILVLCILATLVRDLLSGVIYITPDKFGGPRVIK